jgi:4-hydroxy-tetrahydrodipicolinate synthase
MMYQPIKGVITPTVTPFDDTGAVNADAIQPLVEYLIGHGIKGIYPLGTTGEGALLSIEERKLVAEATVKAVDGAVPVIIHTGAITTRDTLELAQHARDIGADATALITPYYFQYTDEELEQHFSTIADALPDFPIYLYKFPGVTGNTISLELVTRLANKHENIIGLKDSSGDLQTLFNTNHLHDGQFNTAMGPDELIVAGLSMGIDASVSGHSNLVPEVVVSLYNETVAGNLEEAQRHQHTLNAVRNILQSGTWLSVVKGLMNQRGLSVGGVRRPLLTTSDNVIQACVKKFDELGVSL